MFDFSSEERERDRGGTLEFSPDKAGRDVTPLNLDFGDKEEPTTGLKSRSSTLNSITGKPRKKKHQN